MNKLWWLGFIVLLFSFTACKTGQLVGNSKLRKRSAEFLLKKLDKNRIEFDWVEIKGKARVESPERNASFILKTKIRHDSLIWMNIKKLSLEFVRIQISKERLQVLNRDSKEYIVEPFSAIEKQMPLPLNFLAFEDLLVGNPILLDGTNLEYDQDSNHYILRGQLPTESGETGQFELRLNGAYQIEHIDASMGETSVQASFSEFEEVEGRTMPMKKDLIVNSPESGEVRMFININKVSFEAQDPPRFSVPDHYQQIVNGVKAPK